MTEFEPRWFGFASIAKEPTIENQPLIDEGWVVGGVALPHARFTLRQYFAANPATEHLEPGDSFELSEDFLRSNIRLLGYLATRELPVIRMANMSLMVQHPLLGEFAVTDQL